jgi:hypothetical protein
MIAHWQEFRRKQKEKPPLWGQKVDSLWKTYYYAAVFGVQRGTKEDGFPDRRRCRFFVKLIPYNIRN